MFNFPKGGERPALLMTTVKAVAAIAAISYLAANWLSAGFTDRQGLARIAANSHKEPATTGSVAASAEAARLDPCTGRRRP